MNKYEAFLDWINDDFFADTPPQEVIDVYEELQDLAKQPEKPTFTESGLALIEYLQKQEQNRFKAKDISEGMGISSRKISGAMRKLAEDGFISKHGQNPIIYSLTEKGKEFNLKEYKERMNNA